MPCRCSPRASSSRPVSWPSRSGRSGCRGASATPSTTVPSSSWWRPRTRPEPGRASRDLTVAAGYALLDLGGGARLERFGDRVVERPHPAAAGRRHEPDRWAAADLRWDRERGWLGVAGARKPWPVTIGGVTLE